GGVHRRRPDRPAGGRMAGHLSVGSGPPGVRKPSVAGVCPARLGSVHLSIDAVEESILACGLPAGWQTGVAAYEAARAVAEMNLRLGRSVVVDAVNDVRRLDRPGGLLPLAPGRTSPSCTS